MSGTMDIDSIVSSGARRRRRRRIVGALGVALVLAAGFGYWQLRGTGDPADRFVTDVAGTADITVTVTATGTVEPLNRVEISSELSGTVLAVEVDDNDAVEAGQVLARLDTRALEAAVEHARAVVRSREARVLEAEASLREARESHGRALELFSGEVATPAELTAAEATLARAEAVLASARAERGIARADLDVEEARLAKACICAPIDGVVLDRAVEIGQIVASSLQAPVLFTLAEDLRSMELRIDVDEADIGQVAVRRVHFVDGTIESDTRVEEVRGVAASA